MKKPFTFFQNQINLLAKRNKRLFSFALVLFFTTISFGQVTIDCAADPVNTTYCYVDDDTTQFTFTNTDGFPLNVFFNAGQVENGFDELIVLDTDGVTNLNAATPYGSGGNLAGVTYQSSGDTITIMISSDNVVSCATNAFTPWDFDIWCQTCLNPTVNFDTSDCIPGEDFSVLIAITDLGSATTLNINDNQGSPQQTTTSIGLITMGPYTPGTNVLVTVSNADDINCVLTSEVYNCLSGFIEVDESFTTQELVEDILFNGGCVGLSNFSQSTGTDFGDVNGIGAFYSNGADFPFLSGIVLTSGDIQGVPGPNLDLNGDGGFDWLGDADLEANTTATNTNNASYVQFDFIPLIDQISFNFLFASEEYNQNFECSYSDAFAFILTDIDSGVSQNLAVLPGTNIPIEVTNIRPEVSGQCAAINEEYFDKYNFEPFNPEGEAAINYNGQILSLQAIGDVIVGNSYTIKLVIADETDTAFDSAVFIEAGSFNIGNVDLGDDLLIGDGTAICEGESITLEVENSAEAIYQWFKDDVELAGETNNTLVVTEEGLYRVDVQFVLAPDCITSDEVLIEFYTIPIFNLGDEDIITCFETEIILDASPTNINPADATYEWRLDGVVIAGEISPTLIAIQHGVYTALVTYGTCFSVEDSISIVPIDNLGVELGDDFITCFEISIILDATPIYGDLDLVIYEWFLDGEILIGETSPTLIPTETGTYTVIVTLGECESTDSIVIIPRDDLEVSLGEGFKSCVGEEWTLNAVTEETGVTYQWFIDGVLQAETGSSFTFIVDENFSGVQTYSVTITKGDCTGTNEIELTTYAVGNCIITQGISPGGTPGFNDSLDLEFLQDRVGISNLQIFNRFGTVVYDRVNYVNQWVGQDNDGNELPTGTYYYVIDLNGVDDVYGSQPTGWIYLNRAVN